MSPSPRTALAVLCAGALMAIVDETVVAVSLPAIGADLGFSPAGLAWVTSAYLIAFAGLLLFAGRLGDLVGRRRVFLVGMAVFTSASVLCGLAWHPAVLVTARFVQGAGGAAMTAVILGIIVTLFDSPRPRAKALGAFGFVQASGGTLGMLVGGVVTELASWHWVFFVNVPVGLVALVLAVRVVPDDRGAGLSAGMDLPGAALVTGALVAGIATIVRIEEHGWASGHTALGAAVSGLLLTAFALRQSRASTPLLPPRLLRSRVLAGANAVLLLLVASMFGFMFGTVLLLRTVLGFDARETGFAMVPAALAIALFSLGITPRAITRFGERVVLTTGLVAVVGGLGILARTPLSADYPVHVLPALLLLGTGFGLAMPALMSWGMAEATPADSGTVSGLFNTTQQVGGALGLSTLLVVAAARTRALFADGTPEPTAMLAGYRLGYLLAAGLVLVALLIALTVPRDRRRRRQDSSVPDWPCRGPGRLRS